MRGPSPFGMRMGASTVVAGLILDKAQETLLTTH